jgi:hypothetical protein
MFFLGESLILYTLWAPIRIDQCREDQAKLRGQIELLYRAAYRVQNQIDAMWAEKPTELCDISVCGNVPVGGQ